MWRGRCGSWSAPVESSITNRVRGGETQSGSTVFNRKLLLKLTNGLERKPQTVSGYKVISWQNHLIEELTCDCWLTGRCLCFTNINCERSTGWKPADTHLHHAYTCDDLPPSLQWETPTQVTGTWVEPSNQVWSCWSGWSWCRNSCWSRWENRSYVVLMLSSPQRWAADLSSSEENCCRGSGPSSHRRFSKTSLGRNHLGYLTGTRTSIKRADV